jgi:hypothetical protein
MGRKEKVSKVGLALLVSGAGLIAMTHFTPKFAWGAEGSGSSSNSSTSREARAIGPEIVKLELDGPIDLTLKQGQVPALTLRTDKQWLERVETTQTGDRLYIGYRERNFWQIFRDPTPTIHVELILPALEELVSRGSGDIRVSGFSGDRLKLSLKGASVLAFNGRYRHIYAKLEGAGELTLDAGDAESLQVEIHGASTVTAHGDSRIFRGELNGSGSLNTQSWEADTVELSLSGAATASVYARESIDLKLSGAASVSVYGNPARRTSHVTGAGTVNWNQ